MGGAFRKQALESNMVGGFKQAIEARQSLGSHFFGTSPWAVAWSHYCLKLTGLEG